ncbi:hypothetical protein BC629DRAFT_926118 [Irpex lacteus]|nr:hypothetical protein BC629DRAFT_926118 [Irpex lacteus]
MSHSQADPHPKGLLSLSPETLGVVLTFLRSADPPFVPSKVSSTRPGFPTLGWLNVTHVCRYLRSVALEYPALWTTVLCTRNCRLWLPDWLERSKDLPLTVVTSPTILPTFVNTYANAIARAFEDPHHFSRIQRLRIPNADVVTPFLELFLVRPAPQLGTISISRLSDRRRHLLPPGLFAGYAPRLREVNLDGFFVAWWTFKFPAVTHLSIRLPSERCGAEFAPAWNFARDNRLTGQQVVFYRSINALTDALQALPYLHSLKLSNILEQLTFLGQQDVSFSLFLPRLTHLSVTEPSVFFLPNFLDGLRVPRLESLEIDLQRKMDETTANYDKITNFVAKHAQRARSPIISLDTSVDHSLPYCISPPVLQLCAAH